MQLDVARTVMMRVRRHGDGFSRREGFWVVGDDGIVSGLGESSRLVGSACAVLLELMRQMFGHVSMCK